DHVLAFYHFAKDRVLAGEPRGRRNGNEELRTVRTRTGVCHGQLAFLVKAVRRALGFVLEFVAGTAHAGAAGVAALDHEIGDHPMKDGAAVKRSIAAFAAHTVLPAPFALSQVDEILGGDGRFLLKQAANNFAFRSVEYCVGTCRAAHKSSSLKESRLRVAFLG